MTLDRSTRRAASVTIRRQVFGLALLLGATVAGCSSGGDGNSCGGIIEPVRVLTPTPTALAIDIGGTGQVSVSLSGGCANDDRTVRWSTSNAQIATVDASGLVTAVGVGTATLTATAFGDKASTTVAITVRAKVATTIDARPDVDTLSPLGSRALTVTIRDQNGSVIVGAPVSWRTLSPNQASVTSAGLVNAIASGTASIEAATPRAGADSLRDTVRILIVPACSLVRPVTIGTTITGSIDLSTCQNLFGYRVANQYSVTATEQTYYAVKLTPAIPMALVPLNISGALYGLPVADTATTGFAVIRAGTYGFLVTAPTQDPGTYSVTTSLNPDPRLACVPTDVTTGVTFATAITPTCTSRDVRILPALTNGQVVRITGTAPGFPVTLELRNFATGALIQRAVATAAGAVATISLTNNAVRFGVVKVSGPANVNDLVTIAIQQ